MSGRRPLPQVLVSSTRPGRPGAALGTGEGDERRFLPYAEVDKGRGALLDTVSEAPAVASARAS